MSFENNNENEFLQENIDLENNVSNEPETEVVTEKEESTVENNNTQESYYNSYNGQGSYNNNNSEQNTYYQNSSYNNKNNNGSWKKILIFTLVAVAVVVATLAAGVIAIKNSDIGKSNPFAELESSNKESNYQDIGSTNISTGKTSGYVVTDVSEIVENAMPSVVAITSTTIVEQYGNYYDDFFSEYFGYGFGGYENQEPQTYETAAAGSGIIIKQTEDELLLVTNNHVVAGADKLSIRFNGQDDEEGITGYVKGTDANVDVAVVAVKLKDIPSEVMNNIKIATMGDSNSVKVGEGVIAIGNALGYGQSVTTGIISAKDRTVEFDEIEMKLLQTDAAINGGNSGGALLNSKGEVIGINVAKYSSSGYDTTSIEGMGFAIPISSVSEIIGQLETMKTREKVAEEDKGYLGISGFDVTAEDSEQFSMPQGILVKQVKKGGPADKAGIVVEDIIVKFDGQSVKTMTALTDTLQYYAAGEKVKVTIAYREGRDYTEKEVEVTLGDASSIEDMQTE